MNQINQYLYVEIRIRKVKVTFNHKKTPYFNPSRKSLLWDLNDIISQLNIIFDNI